MVTRQLVPSGHPQKDATGEPIAGFVISKPKLQRLLQQAILRSRRKRKRRRRKKAKSNSPKRSSSKDSKNSKGSDKPKKKTRSQRRAASKARKLKGDGCVAIGGFVGLAAAIVGVGNALSLCSDAISMKLENCTTFIPVQYHSYATLPDNCTTVDDYECQTKTVAIAGSDGQTSPTAYKHAINICTYADSSAYACSEY